VLHSCLPFGPEVAQLNALKRNENASSSHEDFKGICSVNSIDFTKQDKYGH